MGKEMTFSAGFFFFFKDKIKELQVQHAFEDNYFGVVLCNVRRTLIGKIKCSNDNVSLQL